MATKLPRLNMSLPAETHAVIAKLAMLQRRPKSAIAAELLAEMTPPLQRVAAMLEQAIKTRHQLPKDTVAKLEALEQLAGHSATFTLDRMEATLAPPTSAPSGQRTAARRRRKH